MPKNENRCDNVHNENATSKSINKTVSNESVAIPESGVKILSRGDLLGAINCLFPELQLKSSHIKLKESFSLFSYSPQELTRIFESGRKYRTRTVKTNNNLITSHSLRSLRTESGRINLKRNTNTLGNSSTKNMVATSTAWKSKAQCKQNTCQTKANRCETEKFESSYTNFLTKFLESHFPDRFADFKNIENLIQELHNLYLEISKADKIAPFNPNLPVLNISECDKMLRINKSPMETLKKKSLTNTKHSRSKKGSISHKTVKTFKVQNDVHGKERRFRAQIKERGNPGTLPDPDKNIQKSFTDDFDDENGRQIARNLEDLLSDDTFTPRYESKHKSDMLMIFQKSFNEFSISNSDNQLEREAIEQYQNADEIDDIKFNLLEIQARQQYEP